MNEFKDIPGYSYYSVDVKGNVKSNRRGRLLTPQKNKHGYMCVHLSIDGLDKLHTVHRAVALAWLPNPDNKPQVNHIDGDKTNNVLSNLEWCTASENIVHSVETGLQPIHDCDDHYAATFTDEQVHDICKLMQDGARNKDIAKTYNANIKTISNIRQGTRWKPITSQYDLNCARQVRMSPIVVKLICDAFSLGHSVQDLIDFKMFPDVKRVTLNYIHSRKYHTKISKDYQW